MRTLAGQGISSSGEGNHMRKYRVAAQERKHCGYVCVRVRVCVCLCLWLCLWVGVHAPE